MTTDPRILSPERLAEIYDCWHRWGMPKMAEDIKNHIAALEEQNAWQLKYIQAASDDLDRYCYQQLNDCPNLLLDVHISLTIALEGPKPAEVTP